MITVPPPVRRPLLVILALAALLCLARAPNVQASEPIQPQILDLPQAVATALDHNHQILRAREQLSSLDGQIREVRSQVYPQLSLGADYFRSYDESVLDSSFATFVSPEPEDSFGVKTSLNQLLFSWGKVSTAIEIAEASRRGTEQDLAGTARQVTLQVHEAFYALLLNQRLVEVAELTSEQRQRQLDVAQKKFDAGVVNEFEVIRARVDLANAQPPVIRARNKVKQAISRLNNLLAQDQRTPLEARGELAYEPLQEISLEQVVTRAVAQRPELASLRVAGEIAEKSVKLARAEDKLEVNLRAEYGFASDEFHQLNPNRERWQAGVTLSVPLFDGWRTRGRVAQASSQLRDVGIASAQLRETITLEAKVVLDNLVEAREIIGAASLNIEQAEKAFELAETSYRYGVATALDVSDAELALNVARTDHARALHDYMLAKAQVLSVMNEL